MSIIYWLIENSIIYYLCEHSLNLSVCLQSQLNEVLDAMFERKTQPGEHVIDQGDDGDNFYVIDK